MTRPWPVDVAALGPIAVGTVLWRSGGVLYVTALVKASFSFDGKGTLRPIDAEQLRASDQHRDNHPMRTLLGVTETVPMVPKTDVFITGSAFAHRGKVTKLDARLLVRRGRRVLINKKTQVIGDRAHNEDKPAPFESMPLSLERAIGGTGFRDNPLGVGIEALSPRPNLIDPDAPRQRVGGFAPIPRTFSARRARLRTADRKGLSKSILEIAEDFDWSYFQAAPDDQQVAELAGNEVIELYGMHPRRSVVKLRLPRIGAEARLYTRDDTADEPPFRLRAGTIHIDTNKQTCSVVWHGHVPLADEQLANRCVIAGGLSTDEEPLLWPEDLATLLEEGVASLPGAWLSVDQDVDPSGTQDLSGVYLEPGSVAAPFFIPPANAEDEQSVDQAAVPGAPWTSTPAESPQATGGLRDTLSSEIETDGDSGPQTIATAEAHAPQPPGRVDEDSPPSEPTERIRFHGVLHDADAAIDASAPRARQAEVEQAPREPAARAEKRTAVPLVVQLIWSDSARLKRIREHPPWDDILDELDEDIPPPLEHAVTVTGAAAQLGHEALEIMVRAHNVHIAALSGQRGAAIRQDGKYVPPLTLVQGELEPMFEARRRLQIYLSLAEPQLTNDKAKKTVRAVRQLSSTPLPSTLSAELTQRLRKALRKQHKAAVCKNVDGLVENQLLDERSYETRMLLGSQHICCRLWAADLPSETVMVYLPKSAADLLPGFTHFAARMIAEIHGKLDELETGDCALRPIVLARTTPLP